MSHVSYPKQTVARSRSYRLWVSTLACIACGIEGFTQVAHSNGYRWGKAKGRKASDLATFPMCGPRPGHMGCHATFDLRLDGLSKAERDALEDEYIARTQALARDARRPEILQLEAA